MYVNGLSSLLVEKSIFHFNFFYCYSSKGDEENVKSH